MKYLIPLLIFLVLTINVEAKTTKVKVTYSIKTQSTASAQLRPKPTETPVPKPTKSMSSVNNVDKKEKSSTPSGIIEEMILKKFAEFGDEHIAVAIAKAESGLRCNAHGDKTLTYMRDGIEYGASYGVFQIRHLPGRPDPSVLNECEANINYAYNMRKTQGHYGAWSAYTNRSYLKHL